jgi:D-alanyl-D-alanine carboxypeptidase
MFRTKYWQWILMIGVVAALLTGTEILGQQVQLEQQLQIILDQVREESETAGAVLLLDMPGLHWSGASGWADVDAEIPLQPTEMLRIASMTKMFVSTVVLKLSEEGKLDLDDTLGEYLPEEVVESLPNGKVVTIRQLLAMSSGIPEYLATDEYDDDLEDDPYRAMWTPETLVAYVFDEAADFYPDEDWEYSNTNYVLLELVVNVVSGTSLAAEIRRIILDPLGMQQTFMEKHEPRAGGFGGLRVRGYEDGEDVTEINDALGAGDGGLISDADGLARFLSALLRKKTLLTPASLKTMQTIHLFSEEDDGSGYGLGIEYLNTDFGEAWGHNGSSAGFQGDMLYFPKDDLIFVLLSNNADADMFDDVLEQVFELVEK